MAPKIEGKKNLSRIWQSSKADLTVCYILKIKTSLGILATQAVCEILNESFCLPLALTSINLYTKFGNHPIREELCPLPRITGKVNR